MNRKPIITNEQGKILVREICMEQAKKCNSQFVKEAKVALLALVKAQDEDLSSQVYNENIRVVTKFLSTPQVDLTPESRIADWIAGLLEKVKEYKEDHIFFI